MVGTVFDGDVLWLDAQSDDSAEASADEDPRLQQ